MTRLIAAFLFVGALLAAPMAAWADPVPRDEAAVRLELSRRFIAALQTDQMSAMMGQMSSAFTPPREGLSTDQIDALNHAMAEAMNQMLPRMFDAMAPIYADIFTLEELTGLVDFYESDIGRSMMTKSYGAAPRITAVMVGMMPDLMRTMADAVCKELSCTVQERARIDASIARSGFGSTAPAMPAEGKGE